MKKPAQGKKNEMLMEYGEMNLNDKGTRKIKVFLVRYGGKRYLHVREFYYDTETGIDLPGKGLAILEDKITEFVDFMSVLKKVQL